MIGFTRSLCENNHLIWQAIKETAYTADPSQVDGQSQTRLWTRKCSFRDRCTHETDQGRYCKTNNLQRRNHCLHLIRPFSIMKTHFFPLTHHDHMQAMTGGCRRYGYPTGQTRQDWMIACRGRQQLDCCRPPHSIRWCGPCYAFVLSDIARCKTLHTNVSEHQNFRKACLLGQPFQTQSFSVC